MLSKFYWMSQPSSILDQFDYIVGSVAAGLVVVWLILMVVNKWGGIGVVTHKLLGKFSSLASFYGVVGLLWFGFRFENIEVLGRRVWIVLVTLIGLVWLGFILKYFFWQYKQEKSEIERKQIIEKYLPRKK